MKQQITKFKMISGPDAIKQRTMVTASQTESKSPYDKGNDKMIYKLLLGHHSTLGAAKFTSQQWVIDRTHDHVVRHDLLNNYYACSTSRMELPHGKIHKNKEVEFRLTEFDVDLKRFVEISRQRTCPSASKDTRDFWGMVKEKVFEEIPETKLFATYPCVNTGYCTEVNTDCGYIDTTAYKKQREELLTLANSLRKRNQ